MPRPPRLCPAGMVFHVPNRANARRAIFFDDADYAAFERVLAEAPARVPAVALLACCLMPNHWHLILSPAEDGAVSEFMRWLSVTHTQRRHAHHRTSGTGHLYQGRFKSFPAEADGHFLSAWPVPEPVDWLSLVNRPQSVAEEEALRRSIAKGRPCGSAAFEAWTVEGLDLAPTLRGRGRPALSPEQK